MFRLGCSGAQFARANIARLWKGESILGIQAFVILLRDPIWVAKPIASQNLICLQSHGSGNRPWDETQKNMRKDGKLASGLDRTTGMQQNIEKH
jgi:hypothetical protein